MRILRALGALLPLALVATTVLVGAVPAAAQEPSVDLTLRAQTPVTSLERPEVTITFRAENLGEEALGELTVGLRRGARHHVACRISPRRSRRDRARLPIAGNTFEQSGTLDPGATREFRVSVDLSPIGEVSDTDSAVYPARIDLRSGGVQVGWIDTPLVHLVRQPDVPVELAWWAEFDAPIALDPLGRLADPAFEAAIGPDGGLTQQVAALRAAVAPDDGRRRGRPRRGARRRGPADPHGRRIRTQLRGSGRARSAAGHRAPPPCSTTSARCSPTPTCTSWSRPSRRPCCPRSHRAVSAPSSTANRSTATIVVTERLGREPSASVARPPQGALDEPSLQWLAERGATTLLAQADTVDAARSRRTTSRCCPRRPWRPTTARSSTS